MISWQHDFDKDAAGGWYVMIMMMMKGEFFLLPNRAWGWLSDDAVAVVVADAAYPKNC